NLSMVFAGVGGSAEVLTGASSYSGTTNINSGVLLVNGSLHSGGTVTVNYDSVNPTSNPGVLSGIGTITGNVVVAGDGTVTHNGVLTPGSSLPNVAAPDSTHIAGLLAIAGNLTVSGTYLWDLTAATNSAAMAGVAYDQVALGGHTLTLNSVAGQAPVFELNLAAAAKPSGNAFWSTNESWNVVTGLTGDPSSQFQLSLAQPNTWSSLGAFSLSYASGNELLLWTPTSVPEPGTVLLGSLAALGFGVRGWRRRRQGLPNAINASAPASRQRPAACE
ncbi:MAG TPA: PEP-CTERM sorting domain-containing protein, partial [Pirellulales bacterium]|nr:PEP-CTERM sorting domain-containing protein [Pirellulales bacterium]